MKKRIILSFTSILLCISFCGCTSNYSKDVHFIHAVCLEKDTKSNSYKILCVCEKQSKDSKNNSENADAYFIAQQNADSFENALQKLTKKYSNSYFASNTLYLIPDRTDSQTIFKMGIFLSQSNILPTKTDVVLIKDTSAYELLKNIKDEQDIKKILKLTSNKKTNVIRFLCDYKKTSSKVHRLTLSDKNKIVIYKSN